MEILQIVVLILGLILFTVSFFIPDKQVNTKGADSLFVNIDGYKGYQQHVGCLCGVVPVIFVKKD